MTGIIFLTLVVIGLFFIGLAIVLVIAVPIIIVKTVLAVINARREKRAIQDRQQKGW